LGAGGADGVLDQRQIGGNAMQIHQWSGMTLLTLVLFRLLWGVLGSTRARFADFVRGPRAVLAYARELLRGRAPFTAGHNPLGGWMVLALLASLLMQAGTGLFANDDIMIEGPLVKHVSRNQRLLTHPPLQFQRAGGGGDRHVGAALCYLRAKRENLILPLRPLGCRKATGQTGAADQRGWRSIVAASAGQCGNSESRREAR
jgi:cytochrome b